MAIEEAEWLSGFKTWFADDLLVIDTGTRDLLTKSLLNNR